jgi:hypothetical protein
MQTLAKTLYPIIPFLFSAPSPTNGGDRAFVLEEGVTN